MRVRLTGYYCEILAGGFAVARDKLLSLLASGPRHIDETYSGGYTQLTYFDVEQRRLGVASDLLERSIPLMVEHDLPICRVVQLGSRSRLKLLMGDWDDALADADEVLEHPQRSSGPDLATVDPRVSYRCAGPAMTPAASKRRGSSRAGSGSWCGCCR